MDSCLLLLAFVWATGCADSHSISHAPSDQPFHSHWADEQPETLEFSGYRTTKPRVTGPYMQFDLIDADGRSHIETWGGSVIEMGFRESRTGTYRQLEGTITHANGRQSTFKFDTLSWGGLIHPPVGEPVHITFSVMDRATAIPGDRTEATFFRGLADIQILGRVDFGPTTSVTVERNVSPDDRTAVAAAAATFYFATTLQQTLDPVPGLANASTSCIRPG